MRREAEKEGNKIKKTKCETKNDATFGKSIENPMNKASVTIVTTRKQYLLWPFRPAFKREKQFRDGAIAIEREKCRINFNKPNLY